MSQSGATNKVGTVPSNVPISFVTNSGTATAIGHVVDVFGGTGVTTSGAGNVITITNTSSASITFDADSGTAAPAAGIITLAGSGSITTIAAGSTVTTELTGLTNHNVLIGAGTTTITKVAPSATSGVPLISQGAAADPAFGTVVVAGGGTGAVTLTGILIGNGTSPVTGNPVTQFDVLVGGASNAVSSIGPGSAGQVLQSGGNAANPVYSTATYPSTATGTGTILRADGTNWLATTATYPATTTINQLLFSSANNVIGGLTTANRGVLTTGATGTPVITALATDGQLIIGSTAGVPAAATLTAGTGITITNASNSITITAATATPLLFHTDSGDATPAANAVTLAGSGSIATSGAGSTVTTALTGLTNHNVLIGAGTSTITKVAPSATSGVPLISQGAAADPIFGTAVVAGGGTGATTFTAYSVITAGTVATGPFQNVSGNGTTGQTLVSNGPGALPTWQSAPGAFTPNSTVNIFDDFIGTLVQSSSSSVFSNIRWQNNGSVTWTNTPTGDSGHPGQLSSSAMTALASDHYLFAADTPSTGAIVLGAGVIILNWVFKINTLSTGVNTYTLNIGMSDTPGLAADQGNGTYFKYSNAVNSGNWEIVTASSSVLTTTTTATAVTLGWHNAQITINAAASSVNFTMDGVSLGNIATNIPTVLISPLWLAFWSAGTVPANALVMDLFYMTQTLTNPR
jgi:hypothetical protein